MSAVHTAPRLLQRLSMHRDAAFWSLQFIGWSAYFVSQFVAALFYPEMLGPHKLRGYLAALSIAAISGFLLSSLLRYLFRLVRERAMGTLLAVSLAAIYLAALVWRFFINEAAAYFLDDAAVAHGLGQFFAGALISTYLLLSWSALYYGTYFYESVHRERLATARAEGLAREAQLKMLRYQLNPHFLFNTLNAISTLVLEGDNGTANLAVTRLAGFLRQTLDQDPMKKVSLRQELEALQLYLGIEQLRFGSRLRVVVDVSAGVGDALVPSLLLQPLVENSLKYAVAPREEGGLVQVAAALADDRLVLSVRDDGPGLPADAAPRRGHGVGLRNTAERLAVLYDGRAELLIRDAQPGCLVRLTLPAEFPT